MDILKAYNVDVASSLEFWGDEASYNDGLKEFKDSLPEKLNNLEFYKNSNDYENYGILAHSIKSEAKYLGFMNDAQIFFNHEKAGKAGDSIYIDNNFSELVETINRIKDLLESYFSSSTSTEPEKIIIVADDSSIMQNFIEKNISQDYKIIKASNGKDAIKLIEENSSVYAILLDLNMPTSNGFEVLEYLKSKELFTQIPVVVITGDDSKETIEKAFTYPILDVLNKPFKEDNIKRILYSINSFHEKK